MATLTSLDLRTRLHIAVRGFSLAEPDKRVESLAEMNFLKLHVRLAWHDRPAVERATRGLRWELTELAEACAFMAEAQQSFWRSKLLDSALVLELDREIERGDMLRVGALLKRDGAGLPPGFAPDWDEDRLTGQTLGIQGLRMAVSRAALGVFARDLETELAGFPKRLRQRK